jgi:HD-like signal output (HDOD) protein
MVLPLLSKAHLCVRASEIVDAAKALGLASGGTAQLLVLLYDEEAEARDILRCLHCEPALAARVLKVANSAYYRQAGTVGTIERALQVLGLAALRGVAAASCMDRIPVPTSGPRFDARAFQRHSLAVAVAAKSLSQITRCGVDSEAFMAGLLHDIGIVLLARLRPQTVADLADVDLMDTASGLGAEARHLGIDHCSGAAVLAQTWGLPDWLIRALQAHHTPCVPPLAGTRLTGPTALPVLLAVADCVAQGAGLGLWPQCTEAADPSWTEALGLHGDAAEATLAEIGASIPGAVSLLTTGA